MSIEGPPCPPWVTSGSDSLIFDVCFAPNIRHSFGSWARRASGQQQTFDRLFDYLVGGGQQTRRHVETERFRRLQIDDQRVLDRHLDRQVAGLGAFEDAIDVGRRRAHLLEGVDTVSNEAALVVKRRNG